MKLLLLIFKFLFENGPNIGFWIGIFYYYQNWYTKQNSFIKTIIGIVSVISMTTVLSILIKSFRTVISEIFKINAEASLKKEEGTKKKNPTRLLIKASPSKKNLKRIYKYAKNYAKSWASDGKLKSIVYYLKSQKNIINKTAQIYIQSQLKMESLTTYLPVYSQKIEEFYEPRHHDEKDIPEIYAFPKWKKAVEIAIENSTSDIEKADITKVQIIPHNDSLNINLSFEIKNREWKKRFDLKDYKLKCKGKVIVDFNHT